jgi:hypothetical protein
MRRGTALACVAALAGVGIGCGAEDHPNEPRPPAPIEITAKVDDERVDIEPSKFGAGLVVMTISNQSDDVIQLAVDGPCQADVDDESSAADPCPTGPAIQPGQPGNFKLDFQEGEYTISAGDESSARPAVLSVGPERASSQNDLLLP